MLVGTYVNEGKAYLPVATTFSAIGNSSAASSINNVTVEVLVDGVPVSMTGVTVESGKIYGDTNDGSKNTDALDVRVIDDEQEWYAAFENGGTYKLANSFTVDNKVALTNGKTLSILGNNRKLVFENETTEGIDVIRAIGVYNSSLTIKDLTMDVTAGERANGIYMEGSEESEGCLVLENCTMIANERTFVMVSEKSYAEITGGSYTFVGKKETSNYAISVQQGARALINTTINGGKFGGGLTVQNSSATIKGIHFEGGEGNNQHGLHIWGSTVDYVEDAELLYVDDVYVQTKSEGTSGETAESVVNGATFEAGTNYGVATGFIGTMKELKEKIEEIKKGKNQSVE